MAKPQGLTAAIIPAVKAKVSIKRLPLGRTASLAPLISPARKLAPRRTPRTISSSWVPRLAAAKTRAKVRMIVATSTIPNRIHLVFIFDF